jgi:hypothetical protein
MSVQIPKTMTEYWKLSRDDRAVLYHEQGIGWRHFREGGADQRPQQKEPAELQPIGQGGLDLFGAE